MARTYTSLFYHVVFSTKNRERLISPDIEARVWAYLGGIARENDMAPLLVGGIEDHVHILLVVPPAIALSKGIQLIKGASSKWMKETFPNLWSFSWQDGYGAFTVSKSNVLEVEDYIRKQREHHRVRTFQEEYRLFLNKHGVVYDEKYLWD
jgi:REP element-mobilizing transposase RayT